MNQQHGSSVIITFFVSVSGSRSNKQGTLQHNTVWCCTRRQQPPKKL